jgi:hypothetical protein
MQKKKCLFGFLVYVTILCNIFIGVLKVQAFTAGGVCCIDDVPPPATCSECVATDGSDCLRVSDGGRCTDVQLCTDTRCEEGLKTGLVWCCDDTAAKKCTSIVENGTCTSGTTQYKDVCDNVSTCKAYTATASTGTGTTASTTTTFINPITSTSIDQVLTSLLTALSGLVVTLAVIFIVLGGILYMMSAGDPGMIKRAKDCWLFSLIGLAIVVAAPTFLKQVIEILGGSTTLNTSSISSALTVSQIATNVLNFLLSIVGIIAIISLVIAGGMYMTAYGDDTRIGTAKKMATYSIIGIAVALISLIAVQQVAKLITG